MSIRDKGGGSGPVVIRWKSEIFKRKRPVKYLYLSKVIEVKLYLY